MILPGYRRIFKGDYKPEEQPLVERLAETINSSFQIIYEALNGKLDINNFNAINKVIELEVNTNGVPKNPVIFKFKNSNRLSGCTVIKAENLTNSTIYVNSAPFITYTQNDDRITIVHISGLPADNVFRLTIKAEAN